MKATKLLFVSLLLAAATQASAVNFLDTSAPDKLFTTGVRIGVNSSNRTFSKDYFPEWNVNSWGTGFDAGVVIDLHLRDFLSLQPGFFFDSRSGNYAYAQKYWENGIEDILTQMGHYKVYNFNIPILACFHFNLNEYLRWNVEAGPYFQFRLKATDNNRIQVIYPQTGPFEPLLFTYAKNNFFDVGVKFGTGFTLNKRYSLFVHYLAGCRNVWKIPYQGGKNKEWLFTIGYDI